ncbi:hypothetical protein Sjap_018004 [Stephania japonica]|uniref:Uncharacterized protein n=1 Tax=Stephania japonica TaxID=461633 RepID=A0AAP0NKM2_9MAGN
MITQQMIESRWTREVSVNSKVGLGFSTWLVPKWASLGKGKAWQGQVRPGQNQGKAWKDQGKAWQGQAKARPSQAKARRGKVRARPGQGKGQAGRDLARPGQGKARARQGKARRGQGKARPRQGKARARQGQARPRQGQGKARRGQGKARPRQGKTRPRQGRPNQGTDKVGQAKQNSQGQGMALAQQLTFLDPGIDPGQSTLGLILGCFLLELGKRLNIYYKGRWALS